MALTPSTIRAAKGMHRKKKRVGRGNASGKGTYSSRGLKGQRSRSGGKSRGKIRAFKQSLLKIPKSRGFNSPNPVRETVTLSTLERVGVKGKTVTPYTLDSAGVLNKPKNGVKIVARGEIKKPLTIKGCFASKKAVELIEKAGGTINF